MNALVLLLVAQTSAQGEIQKQYDVYASAYVKNDVKGMLATLTTDYTLVSGEGKVITLKQYKAILEKRKATNAKVDRYAVKILKIAVKGATAEVESEETSKVLAEDGSEASKSVHRYLDSWVKRGKTWLLRKSKTKHEGS